MSWPQTGDAWFGTVTEANSRGITAHSPKWGLLGDGLRYPPVGTEVEIRVVRRSPYWALVDDD